jgi:hypothetical protein
MKKTLEIKLSEELYTELKICAGNVGTSPQTLLGYFVEDLLSEDKNYAQKWFFQNLKRPRATKI